MGRTRHEMLRIRESRDYPASRAIGPAGQTHTGETQRPEGHVLSLWTALPLQVDFEKDPLWFVANIYPASPGGIGAPKWGIRSRTPLQLVGLEGLDKNQALCAPVRPMRLISPSPRKLWAIASASLPSFFCLRTNGFTYC